MIKFIICDDDERTINKVDVIITKIMMPYDYDYRVNKFTHYTKGLKEIINFKGGQKIYILDIEMPGISGLEIASEIRSKDLDSMIIFLTAHPECKNDIFYSRLLAIDFISKYQLPSDRLESTLGYIVKELDKHKILKYTYNYATYRISYDDILYIERVNVNKKSTIFTIDGQKYDTNKTISELEKKLGASFYRCHKSALVNVSKIRKVSTSENEVTFNNGMKMNIISDRYKKGLKEYAGDY